MFDVVFFSLAARLTGSADLELQGVTPLVPVMGLDAEWRPNTDGLALFQVAFRRSVRLGPTTVALRSEVLIEAYRYISYQ